MTTHTALQQTGTAGWYIDPTNTARQRWFDGQSWTTQTSDSPTGSAIRRPAAKHLARHLATLLSVVAILAVGYFSWTLLLSNYWGNYQQSNLRHQVASLSASTPITQTAAGKTPAIPPIPPTNTLVGIIEIPKIGVDYAFSSGTGESQLSKGPGLWQAGVFPGTPGNATISGHRTTFGAYFRHLNQLVPGDLIYILVPGQPTAVFQVRATRTVLPGDVGVTDQTPGVRLTLTTCNPPYSAAQRLVVQAEEIQGAWASHALSPAQWSYR